MADACTVVVRAHFAIQAEACRSLGSDFNARLCNLLGERLSPMTGFGTRILTWPGDPRADALALRAAGGLNALARSGMAPELTALYPPHAVDDEALWRGVFRAIADHDVSLTAYLDSPPQTNEVKRCSVLLGGALLIAAETGLPLEILEIGASAGLNLGFDGYRYELGRASWGAPSAPVTIRSEWRGDGQPPLDATLSVAERHACDLNPLDPGNAADRQRVMSYIWPDQADRIAATDAAFDAAAAAPWRVARADAAAWLVSRLATPTAAGHARVLMHTIMWQYLPEPVQRRIEAAMEAAGAQATRNTPLAWLRMEADDRQGAGAAVTLTLWPGGHQREIARADFHGRWVEWQ